MSIEGADEGGHYKVLVEFGRECGDDVEIVEDKFGDLPLHVKLACQFAAELQGAYTTREGPFMAGNFDILKVGDHVVAEWPKAWRDAIDQAAHASAKNDMKLDEELSKPPKTVEELMRRLRYRISDAIEIGEDKDGQIVVYTNLKRNPEDRSEVIDADEKAFYVGVREVHVSTRKVMAKNADEAMRKVADDEGEEEMCEYSHTLDPDTWSTEQVVRETMAQSADGPVKVTLTETGNEDRRKDS